MNEPFKFAATKAERIVYVRPVQVADLPADLRQHAGGLDMIWSVHDAQGEQLALVADRKLAFRLALENDYAPVSVH